MASIHVFNAMTFEVAQVSSEADDAENTSLRRCRINRVRVKEAFWKDWTIRREKAARHDPLLALS